MADIDCREHLRRVIAVARGLEEDLCHEYGCNSLRGFAGGDKQAEIIEAAEKYLRLTNGGN